jgi:hypothetical protein
VTEETSQAQPRPLKVDTHVDTALPKSEKLVSVDTPQSRSAAKLEKLVPIETPVLPNGEEKGGLPRSKLNNSMVSDSEDGNEAETKAGAEEMKDVQI